MSDTFGYEVDFLAVGGSSKSGDAICIRWGEELSSRHDRQFVMVVDGGFSYSANDVVAHIKPKWFKDGRVTASSIKSHLKEGLESAYSFAQKLNSKGKAPIELYAGESYELPYGVLLDVWGPDKKFYDKLLPDFNATPTTGNGIGDDRLVLTGKDVPAAQGKLSNVGDTSAENLSGIIFSLRMPTGDILLFTGDAGIDSLMSAISRMYARQVDFSRLTFFQVPHHGSVQNLGPTILTLLFGSKVQPLQPKKVSAFISVAKSPDNSHPSRRVINALTAYNCNVYKTQGMSLQHFRGSAALHTGWNVVKPLKVYEMVEEKREDAW